MSDRSDWRRIITMPAGEGPHIPEQIALQRLIAELAPPGTHLTAAVFNLYADAVNQATATLAASSERNEHAQEGNHD